MVSQSNQGGGRGDVYPQLYASMYIYIETACKMIKLELGFQASEFRCERYILPVLHLYYY